MVDERLTIRPGVTSDVEALLELLAACADRLLAEGIAQWDDSYPDRQTLRADACGGGLLVAELDGRVVGMVVVDTTQPVEYESVKWKWPCEKAGVIHRLAVHPKVQGRGVGTQLMDRAEGLARQRACKGIRLEAMAANPGAVRFYDRRGYRRAGRVQFRGRDFVCFETPLG